MVEGHLTYCRLLVHQVFKPVYLSNGQLRLTEFKCQDDGYSIDESEIVTYNLACYMEHVLQNAISMELLDIVS